MSAIFINEVHPNQEDSSEWVELILLGEETKVNLLNYTIFDNAKQIYKFSNEQFDNQLLVVELSGLNNDQDSVILKDNLGNVLDYFNYTSTTKGLSWTKIPGSSQFALMPPSRGLENPTPTPTPTPSPTQAPTTAATAAPSSAPTTSQSGTIKQTNNLEQDNAVPAEPILPIKKIQYPYYQLDKVQLQTAPIKKEERLSRLVIIGQKTATLELKNAIIGSLLLVFGACCLLYAKFKKNHP